MKIQLDILRRRSAADAPYWQSIPFETGDDNATVATALTRINETAGMRDVDGDAISEIKWECSCLQKKCGACAMVIDGRPALACDSFLRDFARRGRVRLEPLSKFPVVADLVVDRSVLFENLKTMRLWSESGVALTEERSGPAFEASRCLQCGCCLEVCPNFYVGGKFAGAAAFAPAARLLTTLPQEEQARVRDGYREHIYEGCGKSLACADVCPAGLDLDRLLSRSNAVSVWRRLRGE